MKDIELLHIKFTKKDLECISEDESIFVLQVGGLIHEVISLQKFIHMSNHGVDNDIQRMAENSQTMYFFRLLAGTLFEGWDLITKKHKKYKPIILKYRNELDSIAENAFVKLEQYFSTSNNSCEKIRNNFSHHYNYGEIRKMFRKWPENDKLEIYLSETHANCRYLISDVITNLAILGEPKSTDVIDDIGTLTREISDVSRAFIEVISSYLSIILLKVIAEKKPESQEIILKNIPAIHELRLPYFVADE